MPSDVALYIQQARNGSRSALGWALASCRQYLLAVANAELDPELAALGGASDLVQESFLEAYRDFSKFRGTDQEALIAWLRRILLNNLADFTRSFRETGKRGAVSVVPLDSTLGRKLRSIPASDETPSQRFARDQETADVEQALSRLPEEYRQVILWRSYDERTFAEIGEQLGRSPEAARKLWARAIEQLGQELNEGGRESSA